MSHARASRLADRGHHPSIPARTLVFRRDCTRISFTRDPTRSLRAEIIGESVRRITDHARETRGSLPVEVRERSSPHWKIRADLGNSPTRARSAKFGARLRGGDAGRFEVRSVGTGARFASNRHRQRGARSIRVNISDGDAFTARWTRARRGLEISRSPATCVQRTASVPELNGER